MPQPARLPNGAPRELRQFVRCEVDEASLDLTDANWLNEIPLISGATTNARVGNSPNSATITFDAEWTPAFDLEVSIVDGQLTASVAGAVGEVANGPITEWTDALNKTLGDNDKQLRDLRIDGTTLRLRKQPIPPPPVGEPAPVTTATGTTPPAVDTPEPAEESSGRNWGCLTGIIAGVTALLVAIGVVVSTRDGDDAAPVDSVASEVVTTDEPAPTAGSTTTAGPTTTVAPTPTTTIVQVGQSNADGELGAIFLCAVMGLFDSDDGDLPPEEVWGDIEVPSGNCEPNGLDTLYGNCTPSYLPCSIGQTPPFVAVGEPGTDHTRQAADSTTGQTGASTREEIIAARLAELDRILGVGVSANCAGTVVTGAGSVPNGGTAIIDAPLYQYGVCNERLVTATLAGTEYRWPQVAEQIIGDPEPDPVAPDGRYEIQDLPVDSFANLFDDVNTVHNVIGGRPDVDDGCIWFFEPQNVELLVKVLDGCVSQNRFWVFAAATTNVEFELTVTDTAMGTTATYANPLGQPFAPITDTSAFDTSGPLFDNSIFPCGFGFVAYTACADDEPPMETGGFVTVSAAMGGLVPLVGDGVDRTHAVDFASTGGPRYSVMQDGDGWTVSSSTGVTRARALIRGNSLSLVVPNDELPDGPSSYQWSTEVGGAVHEQPVVPVMGLITTPMVDRAPETVDGTDSDVATEADSAPADSAPADSAPADSPVATEALADFYSQLSASVAAGDLGFALDRLDPRVLEVYPDSCPAALESFADPDLVIQFVEEGPIEAWTYEANGASIDIPDAIAVTIQLTGRGQEGTLSDAHVSLIDGLYRWFTFC